MDDKSHQDAADRQQFRLSDLLLWFVFWAAYFTVLGSYSTVTQTLRQEVTPGSRIAAILVCWLILLVYFLRRRHYAATLVHTMPTALLPACVALFDVRASVLLGVALAACWFSSALSFPISLFKSCESAIRRHAQPIQYLAYNVTGASLLVAVICTLLPSLIRGALHVPSATFGALLGIWVGLHQAVSTSPQLAKMRFCGLPIRPCVTVGLVVALVGPIALWWTDRYVLSNTAYLLRLTPLSLGIPAAIVGGLIARWRGANPQVRST